MKRVLLVAIGFIGLATASFGAELIKNGGFEDWTGANPADWVVADLDTAGTQSPTALGVVTKDTADKQEGNQSFQISFAAGCLTYRYHLHSATFKQLTGRPTLDLWWKQVTPGLNQRAMQGRTNGTVWQTTGNTVNNPSTGVWNHTVDSTSIMLDQFTLSYTSMRLAFHRFSSGTFWYDAVSLQGTQVPVTMSSFILD